MANNDNRQRARNVGSSFTTFRYNGKSIAYLTEIADAGVNPIAQPQFIQPLGNRHPVEIVTPRAHGGGSFDLTVVELWHEEVWEQLAGLAGTHDIIEVFERLAETPQYVTCTKIISPPYGKKYGKTYHRCVVTAIPTAETVNIGSLSISKAITVSYTHTTPL